MGFLEFLVASALKKSEQKGIKKNYKLSSLPENLQRIALLIQQADKEIKYLNRKLEVNLTAKKELEKQRKAEEKAAEKQRKKEEKEAKVLIDDFTTSYIDAILSSDSELISKLSSFLSILCIQILVLN